jgi:predicted TPR repeat methyltransferase
VTRAPADLPAAVEALRAGDLARAEPMLQAVLAAQPRHPDALHFMGVLRHLQGRADEALALIGRAIEAAPGQAGMHVNLGNVLHECGRTREAAHAFEQAATLDTGSAQPWCNLGTVWHALGDPARSRQAWQRATELEPGHPQAWYGLSQALIELGQVAEGLRANSRAITLWPREHTSREQVLRALVLLDELDEAARLYREWLAEEPDNPVPRHQLAALQGDAQGMPERADDAYVETVFDNFAPQFDARLAGLQYRAPELLVDAWRMRAAPQPASLDIADLGCGTGLCGPLLRPWARRLTGLDLSAGMLVRARARGLYDALFKVELRHYLQHERDRHDLLASADTVCYFGPLDGVMADAAGALRPGGWLVFTVEAADEAKAPWRIQPSGRYAHARSYLLHALQGAGLRDSACEPATLRMEAGLPVAGWVVSARA